ncbi:MAG TPA: C1 family peptidase, partial [Vicingus sp.]|nr:C1 family peptidase [Vicingus sp.]
MKFRQIAVSTLLISSFYLFSLNASAQTDTLRNKKDGKYHFTVVKDIEALDVQSQGRTGTCWSFSSLSFLESEIIRKGKKPVSLSEMFIVRNAYLDKAINYVRMHGTINFAAGGAFHDIPHTIKKYGIVPEEIYKGLNYGEDKHNHAELDAILKATVEEIVKNPQRKLTSSWKDAINGILDAYFGKLPTEFTYEGKKYTPKTYAESLGLNMDDYVVIGSFTHHPFYETFVIEVPDNWNFGSIYNVPLKEMEQIMNDAVMKGYSVAWGSDVSEKGFSFKNGLAIVPEDEATIQV